MLETFGRKTCLSGSGYRHAATRNTQHFPLLFPLSTLPRSSHLPFGRKESLILASQGTGGATMPHRRASLTLSELSPARLPGALVVRQVLRRNTVGRTEAEVGKREGGEETEAFRLPGEGGRASWRFFQYIYIYICNGIAM